mmetsp:Transcript_36467/g.43951  ORF Transcript_36467/g.43951 Transcript_36467/m.43951 type:complete len:532 (+) Transcript_36467:28-1623(+)
MAKETSARDGGGNIKTTSKDHKRGYAWLFVFIPAFAYYVHRVYVTSRAAGSRNRYHPVAYYVQKEGGVSSSDGDSTNEKQTNNAVGKEINVDETLRKLLYLEKKPLESNPNRLLFQTPMEAILRNNNNGGGNGLFSALMGPSWIHSPELGRGYLLVSDAHPDKNRMWRWEVGNGPITIGRTLHMAKSGCRSNNCVRNEEVKGDINDEKKGEEATESGGGGSADIMPLGEEGVEPLLVVCELGEKRVVRIEENGARTPLLTHFEGKRMNGPRSLDISPFGDLIVTDPPLSTSTIIAPGEGGGGVYVVREIYDVAATTSAESRMKHSYPANTTVELLYDGLYQPTGIAMGKDLDVVYVSDGNAGNPIIVKVPFDMDEDEDEDDDDDDDEEEENEHPKTKGKNNKPEAKETIPRKREDLKSIPSPEDQCDALNSHHIFYSALDHPTKIKFGGLVVDEYGNVWIAAGPSGVFIVSPSGVLLGTIPIITENDFATDVTIGQDGYLYITAHTQLLRLKVRVKKFKVPNMMSLSKKKK